MDGDWAIMERFFLSLAQMEAQAQWVARCLSGNARTLPSIAVGLLRGASCTWGGSARQGSERDDERTKDVNI